VYDPTVQVPPEPFDAVVEIVRPAGEVPHYLLGMNPFIRETADKFKLPLEQVRGGATLYPEFRKRLRNQFVAPTTAPTINSQGGRP